MMKDLRHYLDLVKKLGHTYYVETAKPLSPEYEVSALTHKLADAGRNPVMLVDHVKGSQLRLVTNLLGTYDSLGLALDIPTGELHSGNRRIIRETYSERLSSFREPATIPDSQAPVHEVTLKGNEADLSLLPVLRQAPLNAGKYLTAGMTVCRDPDTGIPNVGVYRQQVKGPRDLACQIVPSHHGNVIARKYAKLGKPMEVVTFIGHHPAVIMAAVGSRPSRVNENEFRLMGALLNEPVELTNGLTVDIPVPARAEIAIEGVIDPNVMSTEGPFSEGAGYYGEGKPCYVIKVTAITMRRDAIYQEIYPVHPEHNLVGLLQRETNIFDSIRKVCDVTAVHLGPEGRAAKVLAYISINKRSPDDVMAAANAVLTSDIARLMAFVDQDIDVCDESEVLWAIATRLKNSGILSGRDTPATFPGPGKERGNLDGRNKKLVLDATKPLGTPFLTRVVPPPDLYRRLNLEDYF